MAWGESQLELPSQKMRLMILGREWYGLARFTHPSPAIPSFLHTLFPMYDVHYEPSIIPSSSGESLTQLHDRCAFALQFIISHADAEDAARVGKEGSVGGDSFGEKSAILLCTHAASFIAIGRSLTGRMPADFCEDDFNTYTCGISKFQRRQIIIPENGEGVEQVKAGAEIPRLDWREGKGVAGGWDCVTNSDCSHLDGGEERNWVRLGIHASPTKSSRDI